MIQAHLFFTGISLNCCGVQGEHVLLCQRHQNNTFEATASHLHQTECNTTTVKRTEPGSITNQPPWQTPPTNTFPTQSSLVKLIEPQQELALLPPGLAEQHRPRTRNMEMWQWGTLSVGIVGWVGVGLGGLRHFFQPE